MWGHLVIWRLWYKQKESHCFSLQLTASATLTRTNNIFRVKKYTLTDYADATKSYVVTYDYKVDNDSKIISHTETTLKNKVSSVYNYEYGYLECD